MTTSQPGIEPRERIHRAPYDDLRRTASGRRPARSPRPQQKPGGWNEAAWRQAGLHPSLLALAGEPPETFCLVPASDHLPDLAERWNGSHADPMAIDDAIGAAFDQAGCGGAWLNRWFRGRPCGLWLWSWWNWEGVSLFNGGSAFSRYVWAIYAQDGSVISARVSRSRTTPCPGHYARARKDCPWTFTERAWNPQDDGQVTTGHYLDCADPLYPELYVINKPWT